MTDTPIDRESVERLAQEFHDCDELPDTLLALRAALDAAEDEKQLAVVAALREAAESTNAWVRRAMHLSPYGYEIEREHGHMAQSASNAILAMIPDAGAALDRALAAQREQMVNAVWDEYHDSIVNKWTFRKEHIQNAIAKAAAIRAQGET